MTGCDQTSKIGTKHAALFFDPSPALSVFGESPILRDFELTQGEAYLVKCYNGVKTKTVAETFNELRLKVKSTTITGLDHLHPTSSVIRCHLRRCYYIIRKALTLLD